MKDDKIKKCLIAGYDMHIISQEELKEYWNYITNLQEENERLKEKLNNTNKYMDTSIYIEEKYDSED